MADDDRLEVGSVNVTRWIFDDDWGAVAFPLSFSTSPLKDWCQRGLSEHCTQDRPGATTWNDRVILSPGRKWTALKNYKNETAHGMKYLSYYLFKKTLSNSAGNIYYSIDSKDYANLFSLRYLDRASIPCPWVQWIAYVTARLHKDLISISLSPTFLLLNISPVHQVLSSPGRVIKH